MSLITTYREALHNLLKQKGVEDVMSTDFKEIDSDTPASKFNFRFVLGNIQLILGRFKTPKETDKVVEDFLNQQIPSHSE